MALCEELHFTRAAEKLGISQPTLSHQIRLLEDRLNTRLFQRIGKKVYVTQSGQILLDHSRRIFYELDQATTEIRELQGLLRGKLSIGCSGNHILTSTILSFHQQYPGIELSIMDSRSEDIIDALLNNHLDLGVVFLSNEDDRLEYIPLFDEQFLLVVSVNHELADLPSIPCERLKSIPLALAPEAYRIRRFIEDECRALGFRLSPKLELSSLESLRRIVDTNTIATILTKSYMATIDDPNIRQIPITDPVIRKTVVVVYRKDAFIDVHRCFYQTPHAPLCLSDDMNEGRGGA